MQPLEIYLDRGHAAGIGLAAARYATPDFKPLQEVVEVGCGELADGHVFSQEFAYKSQICGKRFDGVFRLAFPVQMLLEKGHGRLE